MRVYVLNYDMYISPPYDPPIKSPTSKLSRLFLLSKTSFYNLSQFPIYLIDHLYSVVFLQSYGVQLCLVEPDNSWRPLSIGIRFRNYHGGGGVWVNQVHCASSWSAVSTTSLVWWLPGCVPRSSWANSFKAVNSDCILVSSISGKFTSRLSYRLPVGVSLF